jgi:hypothetical protein
MEQLHPDVHISEWAWVGSRFDAVIENNGSIQDLYANIKSKLTSPV